jgi:aryl-alcohol dehydrogenase-like predicted oxidoreductase
MNLPKRTLGLSSLEITTVGLGTWAIGGGDWAFSWGPQDDAQSLEAMRHAIELGVNWIDTAAVYGLGHSEEVVGKFLHELSPSDRPFVFTKCGVVWDDAKRMEPGKRILTPESIRRECEASLRRLGVERIDLYQFHWPDEAGTRVEDSWTTMSQLIGEGKVRVGGVCNFNAALMERCEPIHHVDSLQPPFSLIRREVAEKDIPWCAQHKTGVIGYSPMQSGLLTESFSADRVEKMSKDDWRKRSEEFRQPKLGKNIGLRDALRPIAQRHQVSVSEVAVAWTLAWAGVTGAIVGARSPQQVDGWIRAATLELSSADLDQIAAALEYTGAGNGPTKPPTTQKSNTSRKASALV